MINVDAIIVTYNRLEKLKHALECYDVQSTPFRNVIIVDNHSTDGTRDFLKQWKEVPSQYRKHILFLDSNLGGSGGFYAGEEYALTLNPDWVFVSDDDAYPEEQTVAKFLCFFENHKEEGKVSAICASVLDMEGNVINGCRSHLHVDKKGFSLQAAEAEEYKRSYFQFNCLSYVGIFLNTNALRSTGLVNKDFFIYQDDVEHSIRLSKYGTMICVPEIKVTHDSLPQAKTSQAVLSASLWKEYYAARNRAYLLLRHFPRISRINILNTLLEIKARKERSLSAVAKMTLEGINDARKRRLGIHPFYRPGLTIEGNACLPYPKRLWAITYPILRIIRLFK